MDWWKTLQHNTLARLGAITLLSFYLLVIGADFVAPYNPYRSQVDGSLLPPTPIYWFNPQGQWIGPTVYPVTQSATSLKTGDRPLVIDYNKPSPVRFFVPGDPYQFLQIKLPLPLSFQEVEVFSGFTFHLPQFLPIELPETIKLLQIKLPLLPIFKDIEIFPGFTFNRHLFGAIGAGYINLLGTDEQGRDQFSRLLFGGRISLFIGLVGIAISFPLGMIIGGISGYFGGWLDAILMRLVEVLMTIPGIYLLVALAAVLPPGLSSAQRFLLIVLITSFIGWSGLARVIRGQVLSLKEQEFVQAAKALGATPWRIITRHILPQTASYIIISATLSVPSFIVSESVLSLIGLGIQQPDPSWGNLLSLGTNASILVLQPWLVWPPAFLIIITVLCFNLLGDGLRDALDPRSLE